MIPRPTAASHSRAVVEAIDQADAEGDPLYTVKEVAATLRVTHETVRSMTVGWDVKVPGPSRTGMVVLIRDSDLRSLLKSNGWRP